jgi:oligopeptide/dipeptide ABC transporter ATP-binding protein
MAPLLDVKNLQKNFHTKKGLLQAVNDISFFIEKGETLGVVGESGCGKSTTGRAVLRLVEPSAGQVVFEGQDIVSLPKKAMRQLRKDMQIIFQDPFASLDPRMSISEIIAEPLHVFDEYKTAGGAKKVSELMDLVGLSKKLVNTFPHELDGGRRQRVGIARALALDPKFIVCDEPVSALDVSIQAQILNLLQDLQDRLGLTFMFISHDLSVVKHISDRVAVMYLGKIVETTTSKGIFENPQHPYTQALLSAIPIPKIGAKRQRILLEGDVPSPINPPSGCIFSARCPKVMDKCREVAPPQVQSAPGHTVACHLVSDALASGQSVSKDLPPAIQDRDR